MQCPLDQNMVDQQGCDPAYQRRKGMELKKYPQLPAEPAAEYVYRILRKNILIANLQPGECVSPVEVSDLLGVSRTPIQGAVVRLTGEGLMHVYPQRGSYVSHIDMRRVGESIFLRNLAEQSVMRTLCKRGISDEESMELQTNLYQQKFGFERGMYEEVFELDNAFHQLLFKMADRENTYHAIHTISADQQRVRLLKLKQGLRWQQTCGEHEGLVQVVQEKNPQLGIRLSFEHISRFAVDLESVHQAYPDYFVNWETHPLEIPSGQMEHFYIIHEKEEFG